MPGKYDCTGTPARVHEALDILSTLLCGPRSTAIEVSPPQMSVLARCLITHSAKLAVAEAAPAPATTAPEAPVATASALAQLWTGPEGGAPRAGRVPSAEGSAERSERRAQRARSARSAEAGGEPPVELNSTPSNSTPSRKRRPKAHRASTPAGVAQRPVDAATSRADAATPSLAHRASTPPA